MEYWLPRPRFEDLLTALQNQGYQVTAPVLEDGAILFKPVQHHEQMVTGIEYEQTPGRSQAVSRSHTLNFSWSNGPQGLKPLLFPPSQTRWRCTRDDQGKLVFETAAQAVPKTAFIGARACDCAALQVQDRHFLHADKTDDFYHEARAQLFIVAVDCAYPGINCFCHSLGTGPAASDKLAANGLPVFDIAMTELEDGFLVRGGSPRANIVLTGLALAEADEEQRQQKATQHAQACEHMQKSLKAGYIDDLLHAQADHAFWEEIGERCLSCGSCTAVCPTCFCYREADEPALDGSSSEHVRQWSSCFAGEHSYIHGMQIRKTGSQRYRQWLSHKFGRWHEQYDCSGCTGCGRCIDWCPVHIDVVEELNRLPSNRTGEAAQ